MFMHHFFEVSAYLIQVYQLAAVNNIYLKFYLGVSKSMKKTQKVTSILSMNGFVMKMQRGTEKELKRHLNFLRHIDKLKPK